MLPVALGFELDGLSVLQRKLLLEVLQKRYPQYWSRFASPRYGWQSRKETLEGFLQSHQTELVREFAKAGLHGNGWKSMRRCKMHAQS
jgi:hypothetical protein